jgi:PadR family transcriptional regulator PadR
MPIDRSIAAKGNSAQTALDLLVLTVLERRGPLHGYGIATFIEDLSQEALRVEEGSLYPALHRMEELGWIAAEWKMSETKRRARFYRLTRAGKKQLTSESERWASFSAGVLRVLRHA